MFKVFLVVLATSGGMGHSNEKAVNILQMESLYQCEVIRRKVYKMAPGQFKAECVNIKEQTE